MNNFEKIYVFGIKTCKFCKDQMDMLGNVFSSENIQYIDLLEDDGALEIAKDLNIEYTPSTVVVCGDKVILHKTGLSSADEIFYSIEKSIPVDYEFISKLKENKTGSILLSFNPKTNSLVNLKTYDGKVSIMAKIVSVKKISSSEIGSFSKKALKKYFLQCGKKSEIFQISLERGTNGFAKNI